LDEPPFDTLNARDLTAWSLSIDNDESRDLGKVEYAQSESGGIRVYVAIADVDSLVPLDSALDCAAEQNITSVFTRY
jgi:exoribonuclease-2